MTARSIVTYLACALLCCAAASGKAQDAQSVKLSAAQAPAPRSPWPAYVLWAAGGAALVTGTVFGISALSAQSDYDAAPSFERADSVHDRAVVADVFLGLGLILGVTGTLFYVLDSNPEAHASAVAQPRAWSLRF